jgi:uncharacterized protein involved in exopolysaccharide biosynthesis
MAMLQRLQMHLQTTQESTNQNYQNRLLLENSLQMAESTAAAFAGMAGQSDVAGGTTALTPSLPLAPSPAEQIRGQLDALRLRYSENHPDVQRLRAELEKARREQALSRDEPAGKPLAAIPSAAAATRPAILLMESVRQQRERAESLKAQLVVAQKELEQLTASKERTLTEIADVHARIRNLPLREQELAGEIRDYEISKENYQSLLNKRMEADMAANMEAQQKSERFTVLDVARVPGKPIKPQRELLTALGCCAGLVLGCLAGFALELRRNVVLGEWELPDGIVVLARVPCLIMAGAGSASPADQRRNRGWKPLILAPALVLLLLGIVAVGEMSGAWSLF